MTNWGELLKTGFYWGFSGAGIRLVDLAVDHRQRIVECFLKMVPGSEVRKVRGLYLLHWLEDQPKWYGSFVVVKYKSRGQLTAMARRPGDPRWNWDADIELRPFGNRIIGEGRYEYLNRRPVDFGEQRFYYVQREHSLHVIVDNHSAPNGKQNFHTVWTPVGGEIGATF